MGIREKLLAANGPQGTFLAVRLFHCPCDKRWCVNPPLFGVIHQIFVNDVHQLPDCNSSREVVEYVILRIYNTFHVTHAPSIIKFLSSRQICLGICLVVVRLTLVIQFVAVHETGGCPPEIPSRIKLNKPNRTSFTTHLWVKVRRFYPEQVSKREGTGG
jgi:hypothetical protein